MGYNKPRFNSGPTSDNTYGIATRNYKFVDWAEQITYIPTSDFTILQIGQLEGNTTLNMDTRDCHLGDSIRLMISAYGTEYTLSGGSNMTFTEFTVVNSMTVDFVFNGENFIQASGTSGSSKNEIDSDGYNEILSSTSLATASTSGRVKLYSNNRTGADELRVAPSIGVDNPLQNSIGHKITGTMFPSTNAVVGSLNFTGFPSFSGTLSTTSKTYDATNMQPNFTVLRGTSTASANVGTELSLNNLSRSMMVGNNTYGGGAKCVWMFSCPTYRSNQRIGAYYAATTGGTMGADPSSNANIVGVCKDSADSTFQICHNDGSGTATKIGTSITPNTNDIYRLTVFIPSNSTSMYVTLEAISKSSITTYNSGALTTNIPQAGTTLVPHLASGTAGVASAVTIGLIQIYEEQY